VPGDCGRVGTVEVAKRGGFVGTKSFVEGQFDDSTKVDGGSEFVDDGVLGGGARLGFFAEWFRDLGNDFVVFRGQLARFAGTTIVDCGIGRTSGFAFWCTWSGGPLGVCGDLPLTSLPRSYKHPSYFGLSLAAGCAGLVQVVLEVDDSVVEINLGRL